MQAHYPAEFTREQGCTEAEWLGWLPGAVRGAAWTLVRPGKARITLSGHDGAVGDGAGGGALTLRWQVLPPRRIALLSMPRMAIHYCFDEAVGDAERHSFMRYFDLYMQRGGG